MKKPNARERLEKLLWSYPYSLSDMFDLLERFCELSAANKVELNSLVPKEVSDKCRPGITDPKSPLVELSAEDFAALEVVLDRYNNSIGEMGERDEWDEFSSELWGKISRQVNPELWSQQ